MKKITLFCLITIMSLTAYGQQSSMLTDGRVWYYDNWVGEVDGEYAAFSSMVFIYGDTIVGGHECKKLYSTPERLHIYSPWECTYFKDMELSGRFISAWYEEEGKVYRILEGSTEPELMFDFGLSTGDKLPQNETLTYSYGDYVTVTEAKFGNYPQEEPIAYRCMRFTNDNGQTSDWSLVEGIGGNEGILYTEFQHILEGEIYFELEKFQYCIQYFLGHEVDGYPAYRCLFTRKDFPKGNATNMKSVRQTAGASSVFYDLQGRRLATPPTKGIYIQNGKKIVVK